MPARTPQTAAIFSPHRPEPRGARIDLSRVPSAMEQLAASWKKEVAR
jgi:hypothetical protein